MSSDIVHVLQPHFRRSVMIVVDDCKCSRKTASEACVQAKGNINAAKRIAREIHIRKLRSIKESRDD